MSKDNDESTKVVQVGHIEINPEKFNKPVDTTDLPILPHATSCSFRA